MINRTASRLSIAESAADDVQTTLPLYPLRQRRSDETRREDQRSPLLLEAAAEGQTARIGYLLRLGVNLDYSDDDGFTALHYAALSGFDDTVQTLLDAGANIDARGLHSATPICLAALEARLNICSLLLSRRASTTGKNGLGVSELLQSGLHCAIISDDAECVKAMLAQGCDVNGWCASSSRDMYSAMAYGTALHTAIWSKKNRVALTLLQWNADYNIGDDEEAWLSTSPPPTICKM